ncbi:MAG TPA: phosphoribulokinase [Gaiellaceae bacterium]|nr:phosphoribulokinase [Gaiellaceae bacterium]
MAAAARPVMLGIVGDSGSGKTTITRGLVRVLGKEQITDFCTDDYHRYDRRQRAERQITPLHPDCNHLDILAQHLGHLRNGEPIMKPVYQHTDGTFGPPDYFMPGPFVVSEGLLGFHSTELCESFDVRVYLDPPENLRRHWKVQRDCSRRGYTTDQVLTELDKREPDSARWIRPQRQSADIVVSFQPGDAEDQDHLDCKVTLCDSLPHPDLAEVVTSGEDGIVLTEVDGATELYIPGQIPHERASMIEEAIWEKMHFAKHLREERLGEFTIGTDLHRSDALAVVQLLILYQLVIAKGVVSVGGSSTREFDISTLEELIAEGGHSPF